MAPVRTKSKLSRPSLRSRAGRSAKDPRGIYAPLPIETNDVENVAGEPDYVSKVENLFGDDFRVTKKDKRVIRHNQLLAKVEAGGIRKPPPRRRRAKNQELADGMAGLIESLPQVEDDDPDGEWDGIEDHNDGVQTLGFRRANRMRRKMVMKSLHHRPGAMKRKATIEHTERDRFARNLANMVGKGNQGMQGKVPVADPASTTTTLTTVPSQGNSANRWQALRAFIGETMEKDKAFST